MKGLVWAERIALVTIVVVSINGMGETMVAYGGPVTATEVQEDLIRSAVWHGGIVIALATFLLIASIVRGKKYSEL